MIKRIFLNDNKIIRSFVYLLVGVIFVISPINIALFVTYIFSGVFIGYGILELLG